jgi:hypothetical protein
MPSKIVAQRAVGPAQFANKVVIFIALHTPAMFNETSLISLEVRKESTFFL